MSAKASNGYLPRYRGTEWIRAQLPDQAQDWVKAKRNSVSKDRYHSGGYAAELNRLTCHGSWKWPDRALYFISDMHGDAEAFVASLVASGGVRKTGPRNRDFRLTRAGKKAKFLLGGDCFDKGPSTLMLLRAIRRLIKIGADVQLLAGNHDVRMMQGIRSLGMRPDPRLDHFFIRMGPKMVPFLTEIRDNYLQGKDALRGIPDSRECRRRLFPPKRWFSEFPDLAAWSMPDAAIEREVSKLRRKITYFEADCAAAGLSMRQVYAAAKKWEQLFLHPDGEFSWFYQRMQLLKREGSFLFMHAGIDDRMATLLADKGVAHINRRFRKQLYGHPFDFYYGPVANIMRTKYRKTDMPLTRLGVKLLKNRKGILALVHGHRNLLHGQRMMLRKGLVNFECDTTMDRNTRRKEGLSGYGAGATLFHPKGLVMGVSTDYPYIKVFDPAACVV